jgi:hypothetical protein
MAKKVRKDGERKEEKKAVFEAPEFDEREYLTEQLFNIRATLFFIILAIPMGTAWAYTSIAAGSAIAGLAVSVAGYIVGTQFLKYVLGIDLVEGKRRLIATTFLMYIFTSLSFSVVLSNPPANDVTPPSITDVVVCVQGPHVDDGKWEVLMRHESTLPLNNSNVKRMKDHPDQHIFLVEEDTQAYTGDNVSILVRAGDASGLKKVVIKPDKVNVDDATPVAMERVTEDRWKVLDIGGEYYLWGEHYYEYVLTNVSGGNYFYRITVEDQVGLVSEFETYLSSESIYISDL